VRSARCVCAVAHAIAQPTGSCSLSLPTGSRSLTLSNRAALVVAVDRVAAHGARHPLLGV
jgi:hypothetical protein